MFSSSRLSMLASGFFRSLKSAFRLPPTAAAVHAAAEGFDCAAPPPALECDAFVAVLGHFRPGNVADVLTLAAHYARLQRWDSVNTFYQQLNSALQVRSSPLAESAALSPSSAYAPLAAALSPAECDAWLAVVRQCQEDARMLQRAKPVLPIAGIADNGGSNSAYPSDSTEQHNTENAAPDRLIQGDNHVQPAPQQQLQQPLSMDEALSPLQPIPLTVDRGCSNNKCVSDPAMRQHDVADESGTSAAEGGADNSQLVPQQHLDHLMSVDDPLQTVQSTPSTADNDSSNHHQLSDQTVRHAPDDETATFLPDGDSNNDTQSAPPQQMHQSSTDAMHAVDGTTAAPIADDVLNNNNTYSSPQQQQELQPQPLPELSMDEDHANEPHVHNRSIAKSEGREETGEPAKRGQRKKARRKRTKAEWGEIVVPAKKRRKRQARDSSEVRGGQRAAALPTTAEEANANMAVSTLRHATAPAVNGEEEQDEVTCSAVDPSPARGELSRPAPQFTSELLAIAADESDRNLQAQMGEPDHPMEAAEMGDSSSGATAALMMRSRWKRPAKRLVRFRVVAGEEEQRQLEAQQEQYMRESGLAPPPFANQSTMAVDGELQPQPAASDNPLPEPTTATASELIITEHTALRSDSAHNAPSQLLDEANCLTASPPTDGHECGAPPPCPPPLTSPEPSSQPPSPNNLPSPRSPAPSIDSPPAAAASAVRHNDM